MYFLVPASPNYFSSIPGSTVEIRSLQSAIQLLKALHPGNIVTLVLALCIATVAVQGQSSPPALPSMATVSFSVDSTNCSSNNPNVGTIWNSGTISITINNSETESAIYQCGAVGSGYDYIQNLANAINKNSPWVIAAPISDFSYGTGGGMLRLISKARGVSTNYP